jgi:hypothetical protein
MSADLKRLHWVQELGAKGLDAAAALYAKGKTSLPTPVADRVSAVEARASELASPLVTAATDASGRVLTTIDSRVSVCVCACVGCREPACCVKGRGVAVRVPLPRPGVPTAVPAPAAAKHGRPRAINAPPAPARPARRAPPPPRLPLQKRPMWLGGVRMWLCAPARA